MTRLEAALVDVVGIFKYLEIPYMLIGGLAVANGENLERLWIWISPSGSSRRNSNALLQNWYLGWLPEQHPADFVQKTRVLPVRTASGVHVDIIFAMWPIEQQAIAAAVGRSIGGVEVRVASVEYLLFLKLTSERPKDLEDAAALMRRHGQTIDHGWLEEQLSAIAEALDQPGILDRYRRIRDRDPGSQD